MKLTFAFIGLCCMTVVVSAAYIENKCIQNGNECVDSYSCCQGYCRKDPGGHAGVCERKLTKRSATDSKTHGFMDSEENEMKNDIGIPDDEDITANDYKEIPEHMDEHMDENMDEHMDEHMDEGNSDAKDENKDKGENAKDEIDDDTSYEGYNDLQAYHDYMETNDEYDDKEDDRKGITEDASHEENGSGLCTCDRREGDTTDSGDQYYGYELTAAHATLPMGTMVKVRANQREVVVRINDRGALDDGELLDLSARAAQRLGIYHKRRGECTMTVLVNKDDYYDDLLAAREKGEERRRPYKFSTCLPTWDTSCTKNEDCCSGDCDTVTDVWHTGICMPPEL